MRLPVVPVPGTPGGIPGGSAPGDPLAGRLFPGQRYETLFIGGGTPSLLTGQAMAKLLEALAGAFTLGEGAEVTVECNPGTVMGKSWRRTTLRRQPAVLWPAKRQRPAAASHRPDPYLPAIPRWVFAGPAGGIYQHQCGSDVRFAWPACGRLFGYHPKGHGPGAYPYQRL